MSDIDPDRAIRAYTDVVAIETDPSGVWRVVTWSDVYRACPDGGAHLCPDREYRGVDFCKHVTAIEAERGRLGIELPRGWISTDDLDERPEEPAAEANAGDGGAPSKAINYYPGP